MDVSQVNICDPDEQAKHQGAQPGNTNDDLEKTCNLDDKKPPSYCSTASVVSRLIVMRAETQCITIIVQKMGRFMPVAGSQ